MLNYLLIDAIAGAEAVYDILLVVIFFSIFLLPPIRMIMEYRKRQQTYQKYINAPQSPLQFKAISELDYMRKFSENESLDSNLMVGEVDLINL